MQMMQSMMQMMNDRMPPAPGQTLKESTHRPPGLRPTPPGESYGFYCTLADMRFSESRGSPTHSRPKDSR
jgi:hypothetical protein